MDVTVLRQGSVKRNNPSQVLVCVLRGKPRRRKDLRSKVFVLGGGDREKYFESIFKGNEELIPDRKQGQFILRIEKQEGQADKNKSS